MILRAFAKQQLLLTMRYRTPYSCCIALPPMVAAASFSWRGITTNAFSVSRVELQCIRPYRRQCHSTLCHAKRQRQQQRSFSSHDDVISNHVTDFATDYHAPVMCKECIDALLECQRCSDGEKNLIFVDGTLGGGGHSLALLQRLQAGDIVLGCDVDPDAISTTSKRLQEFINHDGTTKPLFVAVQSNFCDLATKIPEIRHPHTNEAILDDRSHHNGVDGILLDLGVSSYQIDTPERGFAFMKDGPLDMRMSGSAGTINAADVCNEFSLDELKRILKQYGDEPRARAIAQAIIHHRPLQTTQDLVDAVSTVVPAFAKQSRRRGRTATLARVFQSLRIVVNREDEVLEKALTEMCPAIVRPGGRLVVLSYHSMEDRATKRVMRHGTTGARPKDERDLYGNYIGTPRPWKTLGKPQKATEEEIELNSRARSATLRVAERVGEPERS